MNRSIIFAAITVFILTGCAAQASGTSSPPPDGGTFGSVEELKEAFVEAGGSCADWDQTNQIGIAAESGTCGDSVVLSTYTSTQAKDTAIATIKELGAIIGGSNQLVGLNWIVNSPEAADVRARLGGTLVQN